MKIPKKYQFEYVCCLPLELQKTIIKKVKKTIAHLLLSNKEKKEAIKNANYSKVCDLEDTIYIRYIA